MEAAPELFTVLKKATLWEYATSAVLSSWRFRPAVPAKRGYVKGYLKKIIIILSAVLLVAVAIYSGIQFYTGQQAERYDMAAVPYLKMVVPEISKWDPEIIKKYMPEEALQNTSDEQIINIVNNLSKLGALQSMKEPKFSRADSNEIRPDKIKNIVTYTIEAEYENGAAEVSIGLLEKNNSFKVQNFNINSKALAQ